MSITTDQASRLHQLRQPTFAELYLPKLVTVWREGYGIADFRADVFAGLTVAIVALPLSMAIAIASGVTPDRGLYTAVVGGLIASLLGGSRFQIGGLRARSSYWSRRPRSGTASMASSSPP